MTDLSLGLYVPTDHVLAAMDGDYEAAECLMEWCTDIAQGFEPPGEYEVHGRRVMIRESGVFTLRGTWAEVSS